jgi:hypothetical protein
MLPELLMTVIKLIMTVLPMLPLMPELTIMSVLPKVPGLPLMAVLPTLPACVASAANYICADIDDSASYDASACSDCESVQYHIMFSKQATVFSCYPPKKFWACFFARLSNDWSKKW